MFTEIESKMKLCFKKKHEPRAGAAYPWLTTVETFGAYPVKKRKVLH